MGIGNPVFNAPFSFHGSWGSKRMMVETIKTGSKVGFDKYKEENIACAVKQQCRSTKEKKFQEEVAEIISLLSQQQSVAIQRKVNTKSSTLLTIVPTNDKGFAMIVKMH